MRINDTYGRFNGPTVDSTRQGNRAASGPKADATEAQSSATGGTDAVTVSAKAHELAQQAATQADTAKVDHLRSDIQGGTFQIDKQAIAKRIVDGA